jgi:homoserine kinase
MSSSKAGSAIMTFLMISTLFGLVLGQRYKVLVLVPAIALELLMAIGVGITRSEGLGSSVVMAVAAVACMQIGYCAGVGVRYLLAVARTGKMHLPSMAAHSR